MFGRRNDERKRSNFLPFVIFRLFLSITIFAVFGLGLYQAFRYFSGVDPLNMSPDTLRDTVVSLATSEDLLKTANKILGIDIKPDSLKKIAAATKPSLSDAATPTPEEKDNSGTVFKFAIVSDSHNDNDNLKKALQMSKDKGAKFIIGLGDYTDIGTVSDLQQAKNVFQSAGLPFYLTVGDHDLWESRDKGLSAGSNFSKVFGSSYQSFTDSDWRFILVDNADNYDGVDSVEMDWLRDVVIQSDGKQKGIFIFLHEPLSHPSSDKIMGSDKPQLAKQAKELVELFKDNKISEVFAGNIHAFTRYQESGLNMTTVGAITRERNLQAPRFVLIDVLASGKYNVEDLEIN